MQSHRHDITNAGPFLDNNNPGPGAYDIGTTIGNAVAKSLTSRQQHPQRM